MPKPLLGVGVLLLVLAGIVYLSKEASVSSRRTDAAAFDDATRRGTRALGIAPFRTTVGDADHTLTYFLAGAGALCTALGLATLQRSQGTRTVSP